MFGVVRDGVQQVPHAGENIKDTLWPWMQGQRVASWFWAHSKGHPHTEGTFIGTSVSLWDLGPSSDTCEGGLRFANLFGNQNSHEGARMSLVPPYNLPDWFTSSVAGSLLSVVCLLGFSSGGLEWGSHRKSCGRKL